MIGHDQAGLIGVWNFDWNQVNCTALLMVKYLFQYDALTVVGMQGMT